MILNFVLSTFLLESIIRFESLESSGTRFGEKAGVKLSKHPVLLVVSYDGFRFDYLTKTHTPHLHALKDEGASVPYMTSQFPTTTLANHQSIVTGLYPESHGVISNKVFDPLFNKTLTDYNIEDRQQLWNFRDDVLPIWIRNEQAGDNRVSGSCMWHGSTVKYGINSSLLPHYVTPYDQRVKWASRVKTVISWITNKDKPANLVFLYCNEPDNQGHEYGTDDKKTLKEIQNSDQRTSYLVKELKKAGIYDAINLIVLSDHGMKTVTRSKIINITDMIDPSLYNKYDSKTLYQIQPKAPKNLNLLYETFKNQSETYNFKTYRKTEMGFLNYTKNRRIMDLILLADEGYAFDDTVLNSKGVAGVHGYDNRVPSMRAFFLAGGPLFKKGYASPRPIQNIDLFPLICKIMNIPQVPNNGTLNIISKLLVGPTSSNSTSLSNAVRCSINLRFFIILLGFGLPIHVD